MTRKQPASALNKLEIDQTSTLAELQQIEDNLIAYNNTFVVEDYQAFNLIVRDEENKVIAGVTGFSHWHRGYIKYLWVDHEHRRNGIGSMLLTSVDELLKERNCKGVEVDTMSFQAPGFYEKNGLSKHGLVKNFAQGYDCIFFTKNYEGG